MSFNSSEIIWPDNDLSHCLMFSPLHRFNPKAGDDGSWDRCYLQTDLSECPRQQRDLFFLQDHAWSYYGIYECAGSAIITLDKVNEFGSNVCGLTCQMDLGHSLPHLTVRRLRSEANGALSRPCTSNHQQDGQESIQGGRHEGGMLRTPSCRF